jgi:RNA polymerase sigma-70 factor, ECF subfamily
MARPSPAAGVLDSTPAATFRQPAMTDDDTRPSPEAESRWAAMGATLARAVRRQCPSWLAAHAEDIAHSALIKVMASAGASEGERSLSSFYLWSVAHSALVDEIRRRQRRPEVALHAVNGSGEEYQVVEPRAPGDPEGDLSFQELGRAVRECLLAMKSERRLAVGLYLQGHSVADAAALLEWPLKRTENLVYRGLAELRHCLLAKGHTP